MEENWRKIGRGLEEDRRRLEEDGGGWRRMEEDWKRMEEDEGGFLKRRGDG